MELVLKYTTAFCLSPKKFKVELKGEDETILLEELKKKEEYERVSVKVKVLEVMDCATVPTGKKVQDVIVADLTCSDRCILWQTDIGQLEQGKSYDFTVREYKSNNYLSKRQDGQILEVEDIGNTVAYAPDLQENSTTITSAEMSLQFRNWINTRVISVVKLGLSLLTWDLGDAQRKIVKCSKSMMCALTIYLPSLCCQVCRA